MARTAGEKPSSGDPDVTGWYRMKEAAERIGCSAPSITRLAEKGRLHPIVLDGINFYDPSEVDELALERKREREKLTTPEGRKELYAEFQVNVVRDIVGLVKDPREKIDAIQFQIIAELRARIIDLEAKLDAQKAAVEVAKDATLERNMAMETVKSESRIKELAAGRMVETIGKLVNGFGKSGVSFTPEQLQELLLANKDGDEPFLTPEQEKQAQAIVDAAKAKVANGKAAVNTIKEAAKPVVETPQ